MFGVKIGADTWLVVFGGLLAVLLRCLVGLHPYSGQGKPPMFGDYEAQRHWMEITTNLPVNEWYRNSTRNDLEYWGLDYPPLTAYHMFMLGKLSGLLNKNWTLLNKSRGFESEPHKLFMRWSVLSTDLLYIVSLIFYFYVTKPKKLSISIVLGLLYPGLILIDHGHFQYNSISLALSILAVSFLMRRSNLLASLCFCLSLNYKQMQLYHSLPFFMYLLSTCVPKPGQSFLSAGFRLAKIASTVLVTFALLWAPFLFSSNDFLAVISRQFPVARGVFEDKVSNVWCALNIFYKLKSIDNYKMMRICLFSTVLAVAPSSLDLFLRPNKDKFVLALINSSLAFFLFSFQVHEKTILIAAIPVVLYFPKQPFVCFWFLCLSVFSMMPLLYKDGLLLATTALMVFYAVAFKVSLEMKNFKFKDYVELMRKGDLNSLAGVAFDFAMITSLVGCVVLSLTLVGLKPPDRYPDLWTLLISVYSALHFAGFFVYFNVKQFGIPQEFEGVVKAKDL